MKDLIIFGSGGLAQEVAWLVEEINESPKGKQWNLLGFLDSHPNVEGLSFIGYPVLGKFEDYVKYPDAHFVIAFGDARYRKEIFDKVEGEKINWATLISPTSRIHASNKIGKGVIIGRYTDITVNCDLADHVILNIHVVLGHKVIVGEFTVVSPNVLISGGAKVGAVCTIGGNSFIRDIVIEDYCTIGASSCVVSNIENNSVAVGVPAKIIKKGPPTNRITTSLRNN